MFFPSDATRDLALAAPELAQALEELVESSPTPEGLHKARAALQKAGW